MNNSGKSFDIAGAPPSFLLPIYNIFSEMTEMFMCFEKNSNEENDMPYLIYATDVPNREEVREAHRQAHRDFLKQYGDKILASGALLDEDEKIIGGITLFDTDDWHEAKQFADSDPYTLIGIRAETNIIRWRKRWWNGSFLGNK